MFVFQQIGKQNTATFFDGLQDETGDELGLVSLGVVSNRETLEPHNGEFATGRECEAPQDVGELAVGDVF
jgi:hypothetical protein